jgi:hypothetical protein
MESHDVKPSRIGAATAAVRLFLNKVPDRLQVGLIAFAGDPAVAAPPTTDHTLVRQALNTLEWYPSFGGTAIGDALAEAVRLGQEAVGGGNGNLASVTAAPDSATHGLVSILFLSDGAQTRGQLLPLEGADRARDAGIPVYTVALGTPNGTLQFGGRPQGSGSSRSRHAARDRESNGREVLRGPRRRNTQCCVFEPGLAARAQAGQDGDHVLLPRRGRRAVDRGGIAFRGLVSAVAIALRLADALSELRAGKPRRRPLLLLVR